MKKQLSKYKDLSRLPLLNHLQGARLKAQRYNTLEMFETKSVWEWVTSYLKYAFTPRHDFLDASAAPNKTSIYKVPNALRIGVAGDWGTGTDEAEAVAQQMLQWPDGGGTDLTIHLGDVYYVGNETEVRENCLGAGSRGIKGVVWPSGRLGSFALCGNHEMYANGGAYFDIFLPALGIKDASGKMSGQGPSFFCLETDDWRILGIDTGYNSVGLPILSLWLEGDCRLPDPLIKWLREDVKPKQNPKATIILSHHQYFSGFEGNYPVPARQLAEFFDSPVIWLWGHEHRFAGYEYFGTDDLKVHGRCIGHGGMPVEAKKPPGDNPLAKELLFYDARINPIYQEDQLGFNGFAQLQLDGKNLVIEYFSLTPGASYSEGDYSPAPTPLLRETFQAQGMQITRTSAERLCADPGFVVS
ncbi:MAG: metallophosphoesterase [Chthoniobacteraceae bacterium]